MAETILFAILTGIYLATVGLVVFCWWHLVTGWFAWREGGEQ